MAETQKEQKATAAEQSLLELGIKVQKHLRNSPVTADPTISSERAKQSVRDLTSHGKKVRAHLIRPEAKKILPDDEIIREPFKSHPARSNAKRPLDEDDVASPGSDFGAHRSKTQVIDPDEVAPPAFDSQAKRKARLEDRPSKEQPVDPDGVIRPDFESQTRRKARSKKEYES